MKVQTDSQDLLKIAPSEAGKHSTSPQSQSVYQILGCKTLPPDFLQHMEI